MATRRAVGIGLALALATIGACESRRAVLEGSLRMRRARLEREPLRRAAAALDDLQAQRRAAESRIGLIERLRYEGIPCLEDLLRGVAASQPRGVELDRLWLAPPSFEIRGHAASAREVAWLALNLERLPPGTSVDRVSFEGQRFHLVGLRFQHPGPGEMSCASDPPPPDLPQPEAGASP